RDFHVTGVQTCALPICLGEDRGVDPTDITHPDPEGPETEILDDGLGDCRLSGAGRPVEHDAAVDARIDAASEVATVFFGPLGPQDRKSVVSGERVDICV